MGECITFIVAGDTHVVSEKHEQWLLQDLHSMYEAHKEANFVVLCGDLTNRGTKSEFSHVQKAITQSPIQVYPVYGAHDGVFLKKDFHEDAAHLYKKMIGPLFYEWKAGPFRFAALAGEYEYVTDRHVLGISKQDVLAQDEWLKRFLNKSDDIDPVVFMHAPPRMADSRVRYLSHGVQAAPGFFSTPKNVQAIFHAHRHIEKRSRFQNIPMFCTPPLCFAGYSGNPRGYLVVQMTEKTLHVTKENLPIRSVKKVVSKPDGIVHWDRCGEDWPDANGGAAGRIRQKEVDANLKAVRTLGLGGRIIWNSPVVSKERIYMATREDRHGANAALFCVDAASGDVLWKEKLASPVMHTPAVMHDRAVILCMDGTVHAFDAENGEKMWCFEKMASQEHWISHAPVIVNHKVMVPMPTHMAALSLNEGEIVWQSPWIHEDNHSPPSVPMVVDDCVIIGTHGGGVHCFFVADGGAVWNTSAGGRLSFCNAPFGLDTKSETLFAMGESGDLCALNVKDGNIIWHTQQGRVDQPHGPSSTESGPVYADGLVLAGGARFEGLTARCAKSGEMQWHIPTKPPIYGTFPYQRDRSGMMSMPAVGQGRICFGANDGYLYVVNICDASVAHTVNIGLPICSSLVLAGGCILVTAQDRLIWLQ